MENLISNKCSNVQTVPDSYILPLETRPGELVIPLCNNIPVIDFGELFGPNRTNIIQKIIEASQEFGFFQMVNHGLSDKLMCDMSNVAKEFFELPLEEKASMYSDDPKQSCRLYTSIDYANEKVHYWRDILKHHCHPKEEYIQFWPEKPSRYREVVGNYTSEVRKLSLQLLDIICEGLGLELDYFGEESGLSQVQLLAINHYPPCPDPTLTLGLPKHSDANLLTLLNQGDVYGLQVFKDGLWLGVEPLPNAFVVNLGHMLEILSNGKLKSANHRVVTNKSNARTTITSFIFPSNSSIIEPAKVLISECNPLLYKAFAYKDFLSNYIADIQAGEPPLKRYSLKI